MNANRSISLLALLGCLACGGEADDAKGSAGGSGGSAAGGTGGSAAGSSGGTGGSAAGGSGGSAAGGSGGAGATTQVTIETTPRTIAPGEEVFFCQNFSNPFGGDVDVLSSTSTMTKGSHHMFVFYDKDATDGPVHDCSGLEFKRPLHTAQTPTHTTTYPSGVGKFVAADTGLRVSAHYVNTSSKVVDAVLKIVFDVVPGGTVQQQAGSLFFLNPAIFVDGNSTGKAEETCTLPYDVQIIDIVSHMHKFSTSFSAKTDTGQVVYETTSWDEPVPAVFQPPMALKQGEKITYTCNYKNTTSTPLTFGESANTNEMCILSGTYFPAPSGQTLGCN